MWKFTLGFALGITASALAVENVVISNDSDKTVFVQKNSDKGWFVDCYTEEGLKLLQHRQK